MTYGDRLHLLRQALSSAFSEGVANAVVVSNGSFVPIEAECQAVFGDRVQVISHAKNLGSAPGFRAGMEAACRAGADYILLLDDDNRLEPGSLLKLLQAYRHTLETSQDAPLAVVGFRPENQTEISNGSTRQRLHPNAFFGFHLKHLPRKLLRRMHPLRPSGQARLPEFGLLDVAPYSGMLFQASLIQKIGLPDASFVLYADDTEFSYRVTRMGGQLIVVTGSRVVDIEPSWNTKRLHKSASHAWLAGGSDLSVFYAARNRSYFERYSVPHNPLLRGLNRFVFLTGMRLLARRLGKQARYELFLSAVADGEARRLGSKQGFELA
ncbi:glycosyltransferase [Rhodoferax koreense]|uniref:glycosyltransferase n=1 Tax=Rhodoferax koreensis TaxID=1842727 RepID=UPI0019509407|nr:glycosyltransferase [Rhodoferax koreense]